jgi:predicted GIY-YIG superfamily endonuclease
MEKKMQQTCARWGCSKSASYDRPLCYQHWQEWEAWELEECSRCHWYYGDDELIGEAFLGLEMEKQGYPLMCDDCLYLTLSEDGKIKIPDSIKQGPIQIPEPKNKPVLAHADIKRPVRYIYILKLSDATFYVGQTNDLGVRVQEHKDGQQSQTRGKEPKLVYFESFEGDRKSVNESEKEFTILNTTKTGQRKIRQIIEKFREPLRLLDLEI